APVVDTVIRSRSAPIVKISPNHRHYRHTVARETESPGITGIAHHRDCDGDHSEPSRERMQPSRSSGAPAVPWARRGPRGLEPRHAGSIEDAELWTGARRKVSSRLPRA